MAEKFKTTEEEILKMVKAFNKIAEDFDVEEAEIDDDIKETITNFIDAVDEVDDEAIDDFPENIYEFYDNLVDCEAGDKELVVQGGDKKKSKKDDEDVVDDIEKEEVTLQSLRAMSEEDFSDFVEDNEIKIGKAKTREAALKKVCKALDLDYEKPEKETEAEEEKAVEEKEDKKKGKKADKKKDKKVDKEEVEDEEKEKSSDSVAEKIMKLVVNNPDFDYDEIVQSLEDDGVNTKDELSYIRKYVDIAKAFYTIYTNVVS